MKKLLFVALLVMPGLLLAQAGPPANTSRSKTTATEIIDSQHTGSWELIDSIEISKTDTCNTIYTITGSVVLTPGEKLWVGVQDGDADGAYTTYYTTYALPEGARVPGTILWGYTYLDSLRSQTDATDSIYFYAAVKGSAPYEKVTITNVRLTGTVIDVD